MNKLTKAQAEFLIQEIKTYIDLEKTRKNGWLNPSADIANIINYWTDQEFPILYMYIRHEEHIKIYADIDDDRTILVISADSAVSEFTPNQFKEYAAGIARIAQWLEEQEKQND